MTDIHEKFPLGMKILVVWTIWSVISLVMGALKIPIVQVGPFIATGVVAWCWVAIVATLLSVAAYGIIKRDARARKLLMSWFVFTLALASVNLYFFTMNESLYDSAYKQYLSSDLYSLMSHEAIRSGLISGTIFGAFISVVQFVYLLRKKAFFSK